jgi:hypothetical protein
MSCAPRRREEGGDSNAGDARILAETSRRPGMPMSSFDPAQTRAAPDAVFNVVPPLVEANLFVDDLGLRDALRR